MNNPLSGTDPTGYTATPADCAQTKSCVPENAKVTSEAPTGSHIKSNVVVSGSKNGVTVSQTYDKGGNLVSQSISGKNGAKGQSSSNSSAAKAQDGGREDRAPTFARRTSPHDAIEGEKKGEAARQLVKTVSENMEKYGIITASINRIRYVDVWAFITDGDDSTYTCVTTSECSTYTKDPKYSAVGGDYTGHGQGGPGIINVYRAGVQGGTRQLDTGNGKPVNVDVTSYESVVWVIGHEIAHANGFDINSQTNTHPQAEKIGWNAVLKYRAYTESKYK